MACSCQGNQNNRFRVIVGKLNETGELENPKVVYTTASEASANQVAARYAKGTVQVKIPGQA